MAKLILFVWQLPQHILAGILFLIFRKIYIYPGYSIVENHQVKVYLFLGFPGGISLGNYIFLNARIASKRTIAHEYGHSRQSLYLGPLYLLIVGLPSITMNLMSRKNPEFAKNYYNRFPENWADKLGNVNRG